jgi:HK97 family phage major capsid protein
MAAFREFLMNGVVSPEMRAVSVDNPTEGGYAVPKATSDMIWAKAKDLTFMLQLASVVPVTSADSLGSPTLENDPADADWTGEVAAINEDSTMSFGLRELKPELVTKYLKVSNKMLRKLPNIEAFITDRLGYKFSVTIEKACLTGNGAGQPLGIFTASNNGISTGRDMSTDNTATDITADGLLNNVYNVKAPYRRNAGWFGSRAFFGRVSKLKGGDGHYLWQPALVAGQPDTLNGFPIYESEYAPSTFTTQQYVAVFGDMKYYQIATAMGFTMQRLTELKALNNQTVFIGRSEVDGMPIFEEAFSRVKLA